MDETQESLLKLMLTADLDQYERALAQYLADRRPGALFIPNGHKKVGAQPAKNTSTTTNGHPLMKYQFVDDTGRQIKVELAFYHMSGWLAMNVVKAGVVGTGRMFKVSGNEFYKTVRMLSIIEVGVPAWDDQLLEYLEKLLTVEADIPSWIDSCQAMDEKLQANAQVQREKRTLKKSLMKTGIFQLHKVRSTPETELLFKVVSRLGTEASVSKAFGELLPLITGEFNDDKQS